MYNIYGFNKYFDFDFDFCNVIIKIQLQSTVRVSHGARCIEQTVYCAHAVSNC